MEVSCKGDDSGGERIKVKVRRKAFLDFAAVFASKAATCLPCQSFVKSESLVASLISAVVLFAHMQSINL